MEDNLCFIPFPIALLALVDGMFGNITWGLVFLSLPFLYGIWRFFSWLIAHKTLTKETDKQEENEAFFLQLRD